MTKSLILCTCADTQSIDAETIASACGVQCSPVYSALCTSQMEKAAQEMKRGDAIIACTQETALFEQLANETGADSPDFLDLRDRAGWSENGADATPKMTALVAEALMPAHMTPTLDVVSHGVCLIIGTSEAALPLAEQLADTLAVTVLLTDKTGASESRKYDTVHGKIKRVQGAFGGFTISIDAFQQIDPAGRGAFNWTPARDGAISDCDIVIDVTGDTALVPAPEKREGYLRADPRDPVAIQKLAFDAIQRVGTFEKPLFINVEDTLCAHSRAGQTGCSNCLDICPTGAITPAGDHVSVDPMVCAGCGSCAAVCPSTAITYSDPPVAQLMHRLRTLAHGYRTGGGGVSRMLVHDAHGAEMIRLAARFGRGLPPDVIPLELGVVSGFGHTEMLAALALGFGSVTVLTGRTTERDALVREHALASALCKPGQIILLDEADPVAMSDALYRAEAGPVTVEPILPLGNRRQIARLAAKALNPEAAQPLPLPDNAPYGAVLVDAETCTLCLSCVSLCPSGALMDNPDKPQLRFQEDACLQCGICRSACPEQAISLRPQMDVSEEALTQRVLNEEDPCACVECGALFGVQSTVDRILEKLAGTHPMFLESEQARLIQMCDDCRVNSHFRNENNPFSGQPKPAVRTTDDYLSKRRDH